MLGIILVEIFVLEIFLPVTQPLTFPKTLRQECFILKFSVKVPLFV